MTTPPPDALEQVKRLEKLMDTAANPDSSDDDISVLFHALAWHAPWLLPLARAQLEGWRPIETDPPPHAVDVLLWSPNGAIEVRPFSHGKRGDGWSSMSHHAHATHWMPIPTPPQKDEEDE